MRIIDLTGNYLIGFIQNHDRADYESAFPELFEHYYKFWTSREYNLAIVAERELDIRIEWIKAHIERLQKTLDRNNLGDDLYDIVLFVGVGTTNGHAFRHNDRFYVWLPLETYTSEKLVRIFVTHEMAHALHYYHSPSFYFDSHADRIKTGRLLITEGLATYLTRELLGASDMEALWADFLDNAAARNWWNACQYEEPRLFKILCENYSDGDFDSELFQANDPGNIFKYRAGYYAGLTLIDRYAKERRLTIFDLLGIKRDKMEKDILSLIERRRRGYSPSGPTV